MELKNPNRLALPRLRPAAIVYTPDLHMGDLLNDFADELKSRGFKVGGLVQETMRDAAGKKLGIDLVEVDSGRRIPIHQMLGKQSGSCAIDAGAVADATSALRRAVAENHDLVLVNKFSHLEKDGGGLADDMLSVLSEGLPLATCVAAEFLGAWMEFCGGACELLPPKREALWRWWGGHRLYRDLELRARDKGEAKRVAIGLNWTLVEGPEGVGLAQTPARFRQGCRAVPQAGDFVGQSLEKLAGLINENDPYLAALGLAAINAAINVKRIKGSAANGLDLFADIDGPVTVIGRFPDLNGRVKQPRVVEREPADGEYPETAAPTLIRNGEAALITAAALANRSLPALLEAAWDIPVALVGPGTPLTPRLFDYGVTHLSGLVVTDEEGLFRSVVEGGASKAMKRHCRMVTISQA